MSLEHRLQTPPVTEGKSENEQLFDRWQELKSVERAVENQLKELRPLIDEKMATGELVGYPDAMLTFQERTTYKVDQEKASEVLGKEVWARCAEITGPKLKKALELGLVTPAEFDEIATPVVSNSLVTSTTKR